MSESQQEKANELCSAKCKPCEGGVAKLDNLEAEDLLEGISGWQIDDHVSSISRKLVCRNFAQAINWLNNIAELAEAEQHHPDLHLTGYCHLTMVLTTHAIGGLSENDFILAAKINRLIAMESGKDE